MNENNLSIILLSYDAKILDESSKEIVKKMISLNMNFTGPFPLPTKKKSITLLTSPHKHKKAQENFVRELHRRIIKIINPSSKNLEELKTTKIPTTVNIKLKNN